jgi:alpha-tubulin suppressor-like RCC1 family protein
MKYQSVTDGFVILPNGRVAELVDGTPGFQLTPYINAVAVATGEYHLLVLHADGTISGQLLNNPRTHHGQHLVPVGLHDVVAISCGGFASFALHADSTVTAWGDLTADDIRELANASGIKSIHGGRRHLLMVDAYDRVEHVGITALNDADTFPVHRVLVKQLHSTDIRAIVLTQKHEVLDLFKRENLTIAVDPDIVDVVASRGLYGLLYADGRAAIIDHGTKIIQSVEETAQFGPYPVPDEPVDLQGVSAMYSTGDAVYAVGFDGRVWGMYSGEQFGVESKALPFPESLRVHVWEGHSHQPHDYDAEQCHTFNTGSIAAGEVRFRHQP